jgi:hypothetical protein
VSFRALGKICASAQTAKHNNTTIQSDLDIISFREASG